MPVIVRRGEVWAILAADARIRDASRARPFVVLSPAELADPLPTIIAAPLATGGRAAPFRIPFRYKGASAVVALDQLRTLEKSRLLHRAGKLSPATLKAALQALARLFAP
jgi:mRNA interferase MazF